ncbi:YitT family protein [Jannaschia ovalis]|uniref:YitT family protein n=1 Tax=Jannaschia ovalis TaxID=3038773 RepID=A0ABY8LBW1_9RHOB|nr:YitT family protein [Jannaschia sp. GRR-S6-38]WGH78819.1 YitT family protein [Jannaschia sp. GRR-S6-38]
MSNEPHQPRAVPHSLLEDVQGIALGCALCALGILFLTQAALITGQTAGLAVLLTYATDLPFGIWFFLVNLPFYWLGWTRMGARFVVKTVIAVSLVSALTALMPTVLRFDYVHPVAAAALAGAVIGLGLMAVFRHGASLGGIGILALWMQERFGIQAGWVQLGFDGILFLAAFALLDPVLVAASLLGAVVVNLIIAVNHRRDRYIGR